MKNIFALVFVLSFFAAAERAAAQTAPSGAPARRERVIGSNTTANAAAPQQTPTPRPNATPQPSPAPRVVIVPNAAPGFPGATPSPAPRPTVTPLATPAPSPTPAVSIVVPTTPPAVSAYSLGKSALNLGQVRARLAEAKRFLASRPMTTALTDERGMLLNSAVTIAAIDPRTNAMHTITLPKTTFLTLWLETPAYTSLGKPVRVRTLRANGVNTAVVIFDDKNQQLIPLVVQYPVERGGRFYEMAYYSSVHPALQTPELSRAGQVYLRTVLETALKELRARGKFIAPAVIAEAEKLCLLEHVDHQRFLTENRAALYEEIFTLFALNEGQTYRYAVSTAGAGGLVQMIPSTYRMVRAMHPTVPLQADFVEGMRNHQNAAQAMLLYMQDTYSDLLANETVSNALASGIATDAELMAAGYNSNPARLAGYIRRGGANWRYLIPRETQMYLQIQKSIEATVKPLPPVK